MNIDQNQNLNTEERKRFIEKAEQRTNNVLKALKVLGNCANKNLYKYSEQDINKIFKAIEKKTIETKGKFSSNDDNIFKL